MLTNEKRHSIAANRTHEHGGRRRRRRRSAGASDRPHAAANQATRNQGLVSYSSWGHGRALRRALDGEGATAMMPR